MAQKKIIGYVITAWQGKNVAVDLYEGNRVTMPDGSVGKVPDDVYKDLSAKYESSGGVIESAYSYNKKHGVSIPETSAKPDTEPAVDDAAEKSRKEQEEKALKEKERQRQETERKQKEDAERKQREAAAKKKALEEQQRKEREEKDRQEKAAREKVQQEQKRREEEKYRAQEEKKRILEEQAQAQLREVKEKEQREKADLERERTQAAAPAKELPKKNSKAPAIIAVVILMLVITAGAVFAFMYFHQGIESQTETQAKTETQDSKEAEAESTEATGSTVQTAEGSATEYVVTRLKNDVAMSQMISDTDIEGVILTAEQYDEYTSKTYVDADGNVQYVSLIPWDDKDSIIGMYAAQDMSAGDLIYDTTLTSQHVIADKTYVEVEVDGETGIVETEGTTLPGSTDIKIVAVITTEGGEPVQVLLSEMTLQDRSLESIFNSAGQDILDQLAQAAESTEESTDGTTETTTEGQ